MIATKVWGPMDPSDVNAVGLSRLHIMSAVDASLQRLQTSYIDLYQVIDAIILETGPVQGDARAIARVLGVGLGLGL